MMGGALDDIWGRTDGYKSKESKMTDPNLKRKCENCNMGVKVGWHPHKDYPIECIHPGLRLDYVRVDFYCADWQPKVIKES